MILLRVVSLSRSEAFMYSPKFLKFYLATLLYAMVMSIDEISPAKKVFKSAKPYKSVGIKIPPGFTDRSTKINLYK